MEPGTSWGEFSSFLNQELKRIIIHGCLHLVGFDDQEKEQIKIMREKEEEYLNKFNEDIIEC